ncbi:MAG: CotH kinase family protein [bacterium]|nr:CotH kinase family protein [bacterium]
MLRRLATLLATSALIAAACGGQTTDDGGSPSATPPAAEPASTTTVAAAPDDAPSEPPPTTPAPAPAEPPPAEPPPEPEPEPEVTPVDQIEPPLPLPLPEPIPPGPSDAYFALDRVLDISIEIAVEDWDTLRHQTRTFEDLFAEIAEYELSRPFAKIYTWFPATVTVDGETHTQVGVRKKGFIGSQSDTKPALKLRFDKYVDDQSLGGVMERMTLNNSVQDPSMINTCLTLEVFAAAGSPASRCNFATVSVNGKNLGLYVHVEEIKAPFLERHFATSEGNLYEGTVSDFTPEFRGTIEKKTNEDADDWSDIDAVVAALQDPSDAGWADLSLMVDLDAFATFWATEVLVGHWDGYAGNRNNYWFYRDPGGPFVFLPWGTDGTFHLEDDPNPFDNISDPPPSVLALTAIPNRLYNDSYWRARYVDRLKHLLETVWDEEALLARVDEMAAIVQEHALPEDRAEAAADAERVRQFIKTRRTEILNDLTPEPPVWPEPDFPAVEGDGLEVTVRFESTWGSNESINPLAQGEILHLTLDGSEVPTDDTGVIAGHASPEEAAGFDEPAASISLLGLQPGGSVEGMTIVLPLARFTSGAELVIGVDDVGGGVWTIPAGGTAPDSFTPFTEGTLELVEAGTTEGATVLGSFAGAFGGAPDVAGGGTGGGSAEPTPVDVGLVINEVASKGDPLDWFELHNSSGEYLALANFVVADDLSDVGKRVAFPPDLVIPPGGYLQVELDKEAWPGFALGGDEELGIWTADGAPVDQVDWAEGEAGEGASYARLPDAVGVFRTTDNPTPGAANRP